MLESVVIKISIVVVVLFIGYIFAAVLLYYLMSIVEWCKDIQNKRR